MVDLPVSSLLPLSAPEVGGLRSEGRPPIVLLWGCCFWPSISGEIPGKSLNSGVTSCQLGLVRCYKWDSDIYYV